MTALDGLPFEARAAGLALFVRLTPKAAREAIEGVARDDAGRAHLKARVRALPEDGAANRALTALVARWLGVAKSDVTLIAGATARLKTVLVSGEAEALAERVKSLISAR